MPRNIRIREQLRQEARRRARPVRRRPRGIGESALHEVNVRTNAAVCHGNMPGGRIRTADHLYTRRARGGVVMWEDPIVKENSCGTRGVAGALQLRSGRALRILTGARDGKREKGGHAGATTSCDQAQSVVRGRQAIATMRSRYVTRRFPAGRGRERRHRQPTATRHRRTTGSSR